MGQYYTPVIIRKNGKVERFLCYDYDNGAKLMEHSYLGNKFTETVVKQLLNNPGRLAWVGDYAEADDVTNGTDKAIVEQFIKEERTGNGYSKPKAIEPMGNSYFLILVNHTRKQYLVMSDYILEFGGDKFGFIIHPLPLLTAIGNGKGGGDYRGRDREYVGCWACDEIEVVDSFTDEIVNNYYNYTCDFNFKEGE